MFKLQPADVWRLSCETTRVTRLLSVSFEEIVNRTAVELSVGEKHDEWGRRLLILTLPSDLVDLFHNGAGGYPAMSYASLRQGQRANRYLLDRLVHLDPGIVCKPTAKIWIYEGLWLRYRRHAMRNLRAKRWTENYHICPKLVRYGYLTPDSETRLVIKGESPKPLAERNERIYK